MVGRMPDDDESPILAAMATMAEHGITLDAARADSVAMRRGGVLFDAGEQTAAELPRLSSKQREQVDKASVELVDSLNAELQQLLSRVRSGEVSTADFEAEYRAAYGRG
jgi:hypothetical protein